MKTPFVIAIAALTLLANSAQAATGRSEPRPDGARARENREAVQKAGAKVASEGVRALRMKIDKKLSIAPAKSEALNEVLATNAEARKVAEQIAESTTAETRELDQARLEGLANLKGIDRTTDGDALAAMDPAAQAAQSYAKTVLELSAKDWTPEVRENLTLVLTEANALIADGKSPGEAMLKTLEKLEKGPKKLKINIEELLKCKV